MIEICKKELCTGCQVCKLSCPKEAITFSENECGHIYPVIDQARCIDCKKCERICPSNHPVSKNPEPDKAIACWLKDSVARKISTSGGLSYGISKAFVERGGYFAGVTWSGESCNAVHQLTNEIEKLHEFQGSKYSHSDVRDIYKEIETLLKEGNKVLFSGSPCQVAGLKAYLRKDYENLFTIGLVCHGVPSRSVFRDYVKILEQKHGGKIIDYKSRIKTPDQVFSSSQYTLDNGQTITTSVFKDYFFRFFVTNYGLRPNCFNCQYASSERVEDITVADFWGYTPRSLKYRSYRNGTSLALLNSKKGKELFDMIKDSLVIDVRTISEAKSCNRNLNAPQPKPNDYEKFWSRYLAGETLPSLSPEYFPLIDYKIPVSTKIKTFVKMVLPSFILKKL